MLSFCSLYADDNSLQHKDLNARNIEIVIEPSFSCIVYEDVLDQSIHENQNHDKATLIYCIMKILKFPYRLIIYLHV